MTAHNPIADLLNAPPGPDWTVEGLAEELLSIIAARPAEEAQEFVVEADTLSDRQSRRLLRPVLACLATKSAAEAGTPADLYGGPLTFQRPGPTGMVWVVGQFENRPGRVRLTLRRSSGPPRGARVEAPPVVIPGAGPEPRTPGPELGTIEGAL